MQQYSVSDIQRNLQKLDDFDIIEIVDKKRDLVKGYFLDRKYAKLVEELITSEKRRDIQTKEIAGTLHKYAKATLLDEEEKAFKKRVLDKYSI